MYNTKRFIRDKRYIRTTSEHAIFDAGIALKNMSLELILDDTDWQILNLLTQDARSTYTEIGQRLGIAHSTVHERIKRMEQNGVIKKYTTIIDTDRLGAKNIRAITTVFTDPKTSEEVAQKLAQSPEVLEVYTSLSEELLIIAKITAEDQEQLHSFIANKVAPLPGVMRIRTSIITRKYKEATSSLASQRERLHL